MLSGIHNIHFIGIGGAGMSALAHVLCERGFHVSGSDKNAGGICEKLKALGAVVYQGHASGQVNGADAVVISSAIHPDNCELVAAKEQGIKVMHRSEVLAELLNHADGVAVAGAHGKTTTSAMLSCIAAQGGIDPTIVIGGEVTSLGGNARSGKGRYVIAEADESDGSFLKFYPLYALVTNIENDHMDHYGSEENIYAAFKQFVGSVKPGGAAVLCMDNPKLRRLAQETETRVISYGIDDEQADYVAKDIVYHTGGTDYKVYKNGSLFAEVQLIVPGRHNVLNSLGALVCAVEMGIKTDSILKALKEFTGAHRRFETKGRVNGVWVVDDYAHHPTEIGVTLKAALQTKPQRLICVFQPHRYTRTQLLFNEFCACFKGCDKLIVTDIYAASEDPIEGVNSQKLAEGIKKTSGVDVEYVPSMADIESYLAANARTGDLVMTIGAGDVYKVGEALVADLQRSNENV